MVEGSLTGTGHWAVFSGSPPKRSEGWALNLAERLGGPNFYGVCDGGAGTGGQNCTVERSVTEEGVLGARIVR